MFDPPSHTLLSSLKNVVDHPKEYLADICCQFEDTAIWVHRGILLSRCPPAFRQRYLPSVVNTHYQEEDSIIRIPEGHLSASLFDVLVRYWYTAELHTLSAFLRQQLNRLETELGTTLLPQLSQEEAHLQLADDLKRMRQEELGCDIHISFPLAVGDTAAMTLSIPAHRFILASQSTYFYAMFCTDFCESQNTVVHLTDYFFTPMVMQVILHYLYSNTVHVPPPPQLDFLCDSNIGHHHSTFSSSPSSSLFSGHSLTKIQKLTLKKHMLRVLQLTFAAADYLGQMKTLGYAVLHQMATTCDGFKCLCHDCAALLPSMLSFADKRKDDPMLSPLRATLVTLYSDPASAIEHLWSQKPFAVLVHSMVPSAASMMKTLDSSIVLDDCHKPKSTLIFEIAEQTFANITKHNAIHILHALHMCFSKLRSADLLPTWSLPTLDLLDPILHSTVTMVSQNFDFYCVEYPILVSCVDGIGCGFSIDFLDFLLKRVLDQGIQDANAGIIYQGIVKDLIGRQEAVKNIALDDVLLSARVQCTSYLSRRWVSVKSLGGFRSLEKSTMRLLSDDIGVPYRTLTKPFDSDLLSLFSFRPKTSKHLLKMKSESDLPYPSHPSFSATSTRRGSISFTRRRSFGTQRNMNTTMSATSLSCSRPRSHSAGSTPPFRPVLHSTNPSTGYVNYSTLSALSSQPLIHLLSVETEARRHRQEMENTIREEDDIGGSHNGVNSAGYIDGSMESLLDALLPMDRIVPVGNGTHAAPNQGGRSTSLKFEIPSGGPTHAKSPLHPSLYNQLLSPMDAGDTPSPSTSSSGRTSKKKNKMKKKRGLSPRRSRWGLGASSGGISGSDLSEEEEEDFVTITNTAMITPMIGAKVELRRRPLPTFGTIQYVGPVSFAKGTWIGLELESRLGKNDGCVSGVTYFQTDPQRGLFVKQDDFTIISIPSITT